MFNNFFLIQPLSFNFKKKSEKFNFQKSQKSSIFKKKFKIFFNLNTLFESLKKPQKFKIQLLKFKF